ncbi:MAG: lipopolysaccharide biosynthesis protein [Alistipes sp.]|nr:lipopolysaccharide biosynthesis protein [Alistipes sp.]
MGELKDKTISGVKWNAIGRFSSQGVHFVVGLILARLLAPSDYGVVGMVAIFFAIAQTFIDSGFGSALIRKLDCDDNDYSTAFFFNVVVGLVCCLVLSLGASYIADFFRQPVLKSLIKVMSLNMFIGSLAIVHSAQLTSNVDFKTLANINLITAIVSGVAGVTMAYLGLGVWSLVFQNTIASIFRVVCLFGVTHWCPKFVFDRVSFKYLFNFGSKILSASILHTIYSNLTTLIIGKYYTAQDLGYYSRGLQLAQFPSSNVSGILQSVTYPVLSKLQNDDSRLITSYRKLISMTSLAIFFGMFLLASLAEPLVSLILTDKWLNSVAYVQIFCFAYMFDHICSMNLNILYVKGFSNLVLRLEIIKKTISISMLIVAVPLGVKAICIASVIYTQIAVIINTYYTGKLFGLGYLVQVKDFAKYFICSFLSVIPAILLTQTEISNIIQLLAGTTISCFLYWMLLQNDLFFKEFIVIAKQFLNRYIQN